ncbi:MAG: hypothetical protein AB1805_07285 [Nitrospirota bacterium]
MKQLIVALMMLSSLVTATGCSSRGGSAVLGAAGGAAAGAGGYEYVARREIQRIEEDYKAGKMDQREYEIRRDQIQRMSILR